MTDHSYLLDDAILPIHHHSDDRKDALAVPSADGGYTVLTGATRADLASRHATAPVADLATSLGLAGSDTGCSEQRRSLSRRTAMRGALAAAGAMLAPSVLPRYALSSAHAATAARSSSSSCAAGRTGSPSWLRSATPTTGRAAPPSPSARPRCVRSPRCTGSTPPPTRC